jgi:hypothetical protein
MNELKLYMVYYLGAGPCWNLRVAHSPEEALMACFDHSGKPRPHDAAECSCRVEEVQLNGYRISVEKI